MLTSFSSFDLHILSIAWTFYIPLHQHTSNPDFTEHFRWCKILPIHSSFWAILILLTFLNFIISHIQYVIALPFSLFLFSFSSFLLLAFSHLFSPFLLFIFSLHNVWSFWIFILQMLLICLSLSFPSVSSFSLLQLARLQILSTPISALPPKQKLFHAPFLLISNLPLIFP